VTAQPLEIDTGTTELLCSIHDRVEIITLNRPDARNALSDRLTPALRRMVRLCADDDRIGALLITGAERRSAPVATSKAWAIEATISPYPLRNGLLTSDTSSDV
jgi:1,4-dihydroxy-2-naphthoyl-CoA synthase